MRIQGQESNLRFFLQRSNRTLRHASKSLVYTRSLNAPCPTFCEDSSGLATVLLALPARSRQCTIARNLQCVYPRIKDWEQSVTEIFGALTNSATSLSKISLGRTRTCNLPIKNGSNRFLRHSPVEPLGIEPRSKTISTWCFLTWLVFRDFAVLGATFRLPSTRF